MDDAAKLVRHAPTTTKNDVKQNKSSGNNSIASRRGNASVTPFDSSQSQTSVSCTISNENGASQNPSILTSESNTGKNEQKPAGKKLGSLNSNENNNGSCSTINSTSHLMKEVEQILSNMKKTLITIDKEEEEDKWYNSLSAEEKSLIDEGIECILYGSLMKTARQTFDTVVRQRLANSKVEKRKQNQRQSKKVDGHSELYPNGISAHEKQNSSGTSIAGSKNTQNTNSNNNKSNTTHKKNSNSSSVSSQKQSFSSSTSRSRQSSSQNRHHGDHDRNNDRERGRYEDHARYNHPANYLPHRMNPYHHPSNYVSMSMPTMLMNHSNSGAPQPPPNLSYRDNTINGNDLNCNLESIPPTLHGTNMGPAFRYFEDYGHGGGLGHMHGQSCDGGFTGNHSQMVLPAYHSATSSRRLYSSSPSLNLDLDRDRHSSSRRDRDRDLERVRDRDRDRLRNWDRDKDSDRDSHISRERGRAHSSEGDRHHHRKRKKRERSRERDRSHSSESLHYRDRNTSRRSGSHNRCRSHRNSRRGSSSSRRRNSRYGSKSRTDSRSRSRSRSVGISSTNRSSRRIYDDNSGRKQKDGRSKSNERNNFSRETSESRRDPCHENLDIENKIGDGITGRNMTLSKDDTRNESFGSRQRKRSVSCDIDRSRSRSRSYGRKGSGAERELTGSRNSSRIKENYSMQPSIKSSNVSGKGNEKNVTKRWMRNSSKNPMAQDILNLQRSRSCSKDGLNEHGRERSRKGSSQSKSHDRDRKNERASSSTKRSFESSHRKERNGNDRRGKLSEHDYDQTNIHDSEMKTDNINSGKDISNARNTDLYRHREREREREQRERNGERERDRKRTGQRHNKRK